jgi:hypothetical protein
LATVRELELARLAVRRPGERALLVAEELGFEQVLRNGGAVDGNKRSFGARAEDVQRPRKQLFASPALALEQHRRVGGRRSLQRQRDLLQLRILADDLRRPSAQCQLLLQEDVLRGKPSQRQRAFHHQQEMIGIDWFGEKVERTLFHRRDCILNAAERGHDDDRKFGVEILGGPKHAEAVSLRQTKVGEHETGPAGAERLDRFRLIARFDNFVTLSLERKTQHRAQRVFVLDEEDWGIGRVT